MNFESSDQNFQASVTAFTRTDAGEKITTPILLELLAEINRVPMNLSEESKAEIYKTITKAYTPAAIETFNLRALVATYVLRLTQDAEKSKSKLTPATLKTISNRLQVDAERLVWYNRMLK